MTVLSHSTCGAFIFSEERTVCGGAQEISCDSPLYALCPSRHGDGIRPA